MERVGRLGDNLSALCLGLRKLVIVDISLSRDQDNPQLIFESMNSTGRELSQADLIRNFILMDLDPDHQNRLYDEHWRPMEVSFGQEAYGDHFDAFMRCYLTLKTGDIPNVRAVYEAFKTYARSPGVEETGIDAIVADIHRFAEHFCRMALDKEADKELAAAFHDLRELKVDVAYPLLLELYEDYCQGALSKPDFAAIVRLVESYVFRRAVCGMPPNSLNKTFATFTRSVRKGCYLESAQAHMLLMPTYRRFPSDEDFTRDLAARDVYNFPRCRYLLKRLENHGRKERVPTDEYTIEHIMPQTISSQWREALGPDWKHTHETFLHTLGNLTLTGYNPEYSNRAFIDKRDRQGGFQHSPLRLNDGLGQLERWDGDAIQARAAQLAAWSCDVWPAPNLPESLLEQYRPVEDKPAAYSVTDHQHLHEEGAMRPVFEAFRQAVLSLDPCVSEEFLKRYIAYKAETNFVDVVPQKSRLRLSLNLRFHELSDPRGIAKDVSNLGRWGNGDVEVGLSTLDDLAYVLGLVRQAFEKQMEGDG